MRPRFRILACLAICLLTATLLSAGAAAAPGVPEVRTLPNGLIVVLLEDHALPLVAVSLWVHAGSKDEIETSAGYAHFLEHMVQRGTDTTGPFEYQRLAQRWGGSFSVRSNYDRTSMTLSGVPGVLDKLVDAAAAIAFRSALKDSEIDLELSTLNQEIRTYYDQGSTVAFLESIRATYPDHPYRFPLLGNFRTLGSLKHDPLTAFYKNLYVANNMAIAVAGDLDPKRAMAIVEASFGQAPKSLTLPPKPPLPSAFVGHKQIVKEKRLDLKEPWVALSFAGPGYRSPDRPAFEILARALGEAGGSPVQAALQREGAGNSARATYYGLEDVGMLYISVSPLTPLLSYNAARVALQEVVDFKKRMVKEPQLRALVELVLREEKTRAGSFAERAEALGEAALFGGIRYYWDLPDLYRRLTPEDVRRVASKYLVGDNVRLVVLLPKKADEIPDEPKDRLHAVADDLGTASQGSSPGFGATLYSGEEASRVNPAAWGNPRDAAGLKAPERTVLDNGLTVVLQEDHRIAIAAAVLEIAVGSVDDPPGREGTASLSARLLAGAFSARARAEIARAGDRVLSLPEVQVSRDLTEARLLVSPGGLRSGLQMLAEGVRRPVTDDASFASARQAALDAVARGERDPDLVASDLFRENVYAGGPYAHPALGSNATLQALSREGVQAFQAIHLRPAKTVIAIAGDVAPADVLAAVRELFGDWKGEKVSAESAATQPAKEPGGRPRAGEFSRALPDVQSRLLVGVPGVEIRHPDFQALRLLGTELTLEIFEDMVFKRRAAFSVTALPEGLRTTGSLALQVVAQVGRIDEAAFDVQKLMRRLALEELPADELADLARVQTGRDAQALQGTLAVAAALAYREAAGLGALGYRSALTQPMASTPGSLREAAERYLKPESWIVVKIAPPGV
jgi:zinc protease